MGLPKTSCLEHLFTSASPPYPLFVDIHSGPYARSTSWFTGDSWFWLPYLVSRGYAIFEANYRGGKSHGEAYGAAARQNPGTTDLEDITSVLRHTLKVHSDKIEANRVSVGGWSSDGFLTYLGVVRGIQSAAETAISTTNKNPTQENEAVEAKLTPVHFRAAVCGAGITDWDMINRTGDIPALRLELGGASPWTVPRSSTHGRNGSAIWEMHEAASAISAATALDDKTVKREDLLTPFLILHGENDSRVPVSQAKAFRTGCQIHDWPFEMVTYPRGGHVLGERKQVVDMMVRVDKFLEKWIK